VTCAAASAKPARPIDTVVHGRARRLARAARHGRGAPARSRAAEPADASLESLAQTVVSRAASPRRAVWRTRWRRSSDRRWPSASTSCSIRSGVRIAAGAADSPDAAARRGHAAQRRARHRDVRDRAPAGHPAPIRVLTAPVWKAAAWSSWCRWRCRSRWWRRPAALPPDPGRAAARGAARGGSGWMVLAGRRRPSTPWSTPPRIGAEDLSQRLVADDPHDELGGSPRC
jgi:hypothetical protein